MSNETSLRKFEHIDVVLKEDVSIPGFCEEIYSGIRLVHNALPGFNYNDIDTAIEFLGYTLKAPIMITGMTGGHSEVIKINELLARIAQEEGIAIGVGSQRALIENKGVEEVVRSYTIVREIAKDVPVIGNIGLNTLNDLEVSDVEYIVKTLNADALAIHLNPGQELIQLEGDTRFNEDLLEKVRDIKYVIGVPVIVKEVGNGLSMEVVKKFHGIGVDYFDVAGACGTNWILVEGYRALRKGDEKRFFLSKKLSRWGIPTPLSVIETRWAAPSSFIIASGGVWDGFKAGVNIAIGADMAGFAASILRILLTKGYSMAREYVRNYVNELKTLMFLVGASNVKELKGKPVYLSEYVNNLIKSRGIDWSLYLELIKS